MRVFPIVFTIMILLALIPVSVFALGEIKTCTMSSAMPNTHFQAFDCTALKMNMIPDYANGNSSELTMGVFGVNFGLKASSRLEFDAWYYGYSSNHANDESKHQNSYELQAKYLCWQKDSQYLSVAPGLISSYGHYKLWFLYEANPYEKCSAQGFEIPIIYTLDTKRHLCLNLSAGINCEWVKDWGASIEYNDETFDYFLVHYDHGSSTVLHGIVNAGAEIDFDHFILTPELGITFVNVGNEGVRQIMNAGVSGGLRW